jgi:hypothetical protein
VSSTFPSAIEGDPTGSGGGGRALISHVHGTTFFNPEPPSAAFRLFRESSQIVSESVALGTRSDLGRIR